MFKEFNILNSYTLEATFYAPLNKILKKKYVHEDLQIKVEELNLMGADFAQNMIQIIHSKILKKKFNVDSTLNGINSSTNYGQPP